MSKKSRRKQKYAERQAAIDAVIADKRSQKVEEPAVYDVPFVERPFAGMVNEIEIVALKELLPAATLTVRTTAEYGDRDVVLTTVLPNQVQGMVRKDDNLIMVALQTRSTTRNAAHDIAVVLSELLKAQPGAVIDNLDLRVAAPALSDMLVNEPGTFVVHRDFGYWLTDEAAQGEDAKRAIEDSAEGLVPCRQIGDERGAYWTRMNADFVRWVWTENDDKMFDALARLRVAGKCTLGSGSFFIGAFRTLGLIVPVWEFPERVEADDLIAGLKSGRAALEKALKDETPLSYEERRARAGLVSRQVALA